MKLINSQKKRVLEKGKLLTLGIKVNKIIDPKYLKN